MLGDDVPTAIRSRLKLRYARAPHDFCSGDLSRLRIGMRDAVRIHVPLDGIVHGAGEMPLVHQGKELRCLVDRDDFKFHTEIAAARLRHLQPVEPLLRASEHDAARDMHAAGLARNPLYFLIELDRVLLQLGDIRVAIDGVHASCGVPSGAGGQFGSLDKQHVLPAGLRQVIQNTDAHDAPADHHRLRMFLHCSIPIDVRVPVRASFPRAFGHRAARARPASFMYLRPRGAAVDLRTPGGCRSARSATSETERLRCRSSLPDG